MEFDWKALGKKIAKIGAPLLGTAIGGPAGPVLGALVASAVGGDAEDPGSIGRAIDANPEAAVRLAEVESNNRVRLEELAVRRYEAGLAAESAEFAEANTTIRSEHEHGTTYAKDTRPWAARKSAAVGFSYGILSEIGQAFDYGDGASVELLGIFLGPLVYYMTMRTVDGFSKQGRTK